MKKKVLSMILATSMLAALTTGCGSSDEAASTNKDSKGTMFVWAKIPKGFSSSQEFCLELMEKAGVICTPGHAFGSMGEGYVRFALVLPVEEIKEMLEVVKESRILE